MRAGVARAADATASIMGAPTQAWDLPAVGRIVDHRVGVTDTPPAREFGTRARADDAALSDAGTMIGSVAATGISGAGGMRIAHAPCDRS